MMLDEAVRLTEMLMGLAFAQQSLEHLATRDSARIFLPRLVLSVLLMLGVATSWVSVGLVVLALCMLNRFQGPYNGGSDRMSLLMLCCMCVSYFMPTEHLRELAIGYLALQLVLSYFIAGWVKIANPEWRTGRALRDVFLFSAYPVSESLRGWANRPGVMLMMSWAVMLFELGFPLTMVTHDSLMVGLVIAACFHFANACLFGFNRFFWIWLAAYPSILWLQERISA